MSNGRKKIVVAIIAMLCLLVAVWFLWLMPAPTISAEQIGQLTITALPSPPTKKVITNRAEIQSFAVLLNSIPLHRSPHLGEKGGWQFLIATDNQYGTIVILGKEVKINGFWYATDADIADKMEKFYRKLPEKSIQQ